jgi:hypothetical protein
MIAVRGRRQQGDGPTYANITPRLVGAALNFEAAWERSGGQLHSLRHPGDLNDVNAEVQPDAGTLVTFHRSDRSSFGHERFAGIRRNVMINWTTGTFAARRRPFRSRISVNAKHAFAHAEVA